jgi:hypothetical protein
MNIVSFGAYSFPDTQSSIINNFGDTVPRTTRLPGMSGGFDEYGDDAAAHEIGRVTVRFWLHADTPAAMQGKRDAVRAMARYGRATLTTLDDYGVQRSTKARVNSIQMPDDVIARAQRTQQVTVDFQVALPRWYSTASSSPVTTACSGTATDFTITNNGNADALPIITIDPGATLTSGVKVQRIVSATVVDEVDYDASLVASDLLVINCQSLTVQKNSTDAYGTTFTALHPAWLRLLPGANSLRVVLVGAETASVAIAFDDTWY